MNQIPLVDESRLVKLVSDPPTATRRWDNRAACADLAPASDPYFPEAGELPPREALARCFTCPVAHECLATAIRHEAEEGLRFGWWGGYGPDERDALARRLGIHTQPEIDLGRPADLARHLRAASRTVPSIAAELGCTERTVYRYLASTAA
jgi:hypothetical protein